MVLHLKNKCTQSLDTSAAGSTCIQDARSLELQQCVSRHTTLQQGAHPTPRTASYMVRVTAYAWNRRQGFQVCLPGKTSRSHKTAALRSLAACPAPANRGQQACACGQPRAWMAGAYKIQAGCGALLL